MTKCNIMTLNKAEEARGGKKARDNLQTRLCSWWFVRLVVKNLEEFQPRTTRTNTNGREEEEARVGNRACREGRRSPLGNRARG